MKIQVIGCGDAFGSGGRFNTCFLLEDGGERILVDCGASSLVALKKFGVDPDSIGTVVLTHLHGDHFGGLIFLLREATLFKRRTKALVIGGPEGTAERLENAMEAFFPGGWIANPAFGLTIMAYRAEEPVSIGPLQVKPYSTRHACGAPPYALRIRFAGKTITYTGDTEWVDSLVDAGKESDLLICESYVYSTPVNKHLSY